MTVHAAKGLEFPQVYIPSVSPSWFPQTLGRISALCRPVLRRMTR